ncbi:MAG: sulfur carrier protein ThiS [Gammaproteobacteria bacterium]
MQIIVNGETRQVAEQISAAELVESLGLGQRRLALEVNGEIVPRSQYASHGLAAGDRVEIVHAVGGG